MAMHTALKKNPRTATGLVAEVVERKDAPGVWSVEAVDDASEGAVYSAVFYGPQSKERAEEYAHMKYSD